MLRDFTVLAGVIVVLAIVALLLPLWPLEKKKLVQINDMIDQCVILLIVLLSGYQTIHSSISLWNKRISIAVIHLNVMVLVLWTHYNDRRGNRGEPVTVVTWFFDPRCMMSSVVPDVRDEGCGHAAIDMKGQLKEKKKHKHNIGLKWNDAKEDDYVSWWPVGGEDERNDGARPGGPNDSYDKDARGEGSESSGDGGSQPADQFVQIFGLDKEAMKAAWRERKNMKHPRWHLFGPSCSTTSMDCLKAGGVFCWHEWYRINWRCILRPVVYLCDKILPLGTMSGLKTHGCDISTQLHLIGGVLTPSDVAVFARTTVSPVCDVARAIYFCCFATGLLEVVSTAETLLVPFTKPITLLCWLCGVPGKEIEHQIHFLMIGFTTIGLMVCITQGLGRFGKEVKVYDNLNAFKDMNFWECVDKILEGAYLNRRLGFVFVTLELSWVLWRSSLALFNFGRTVVKHARVIYWVGMILLVVASYLKLNSAYYAKVMKKRVSDALQGPQADSPKAKPKRRAADGAEAESSTGRPSKKQKTD